MYRPTLPSIARQRQRCYAYNARHRKLCPLHNPACHTGRQDCTSSSGGLYQGQLPHIFSPKARPTEDSRNTRATRLWLVNRSASVRLATPLRLQTSVEDLVHTVHEQPPEEQDDQHARKVHDEDSQTPSWRGSQAFLSPFFSCENLGSDIQAAPLGTSVTW